MKNDDIESENLPNEECAQLQRENEQLRHESAGLRGEVEFLKHENWRLESELGRLERRVQSLEAFLGETLIDSEERIQRMETLAEAQKNVADGIEQFVKHSWHFSAEQREVMDEIQRLTQHAQHIRSVIASNSIVKLAKQEKRPEVLRPTE